MLIFIVILLTGCTWNWDIAPKNPTIIVSKRFDLNVDLVLTREFKDAEWRANVSPVDIAVIPLGQALTNHSVNLAKALFREVHVSDSSAVPISSPANAALIPRLVAAERTQPTTIFGEQTSTLIVEWTFTDPTGSIIWVDTVTGQGWSEAMGAFPENSAQDQMAAAFEQLFEKTRQSIISSPEIAQYASAQ